MILHPDLSKKNIFETFGRLNPKKEGKPLLLKTEKTNHVDLDILRFPNLLLYMSNTISNI